MCKEILLEIKGLKTYYYTEKGIVYAVNDVNLEIYKGEVFALIGESGCGKSTVAHSILRLVSPPGKIVTGEILFDNKDILKASRKEMQNIRGAKIAMIYQDPMSSLNPVYTIGDQISEAIELHQKGSKNEIKNKIIKLLRETRIPSPDKMMSSYPHEFSGGMRQRAMIAMMLSCNPRLLIADEPTTSLDVTVQAQILELIKDLRKNYDSSILYITHNLAITAELAERIAVMYAGKIIECADTLTIFKNPMHPYTRALLNSIPKIGKKREEKLEVIPGSVPSLIDNPPGCIFSSRCRYVKDVCRKKSPELIDVEPGHKSACIRAFEI